MRFTAIAVSAAVLGAAMAMPASIVYETEVVTITSCAPEKTNCPGRTQTSAVVPTTAPVAVPTTVSAPVVVPTTVSAPVVVPTTVSAPVVVPTTIAAVDSVVVSSVVPTTVAAVESVVVPSVVPTTIAAVESAVVPSADPSVAPTTVAAVESAVVPSADPSVVPTTVAAIESVIPLPSSIPVTYPNGTAPAAGSAVPVYSWTPSASASLPSASHNASTPVVPSVPVVPSPTSDLSSGATTNGLSFAAAAIAAAAFIFA